MVVYSIFIATHSRCSPSVQEHTATICCKGATTSVVQFPVTVAEGYKVMSKMYLQVFISNLEKQVASFPFREKLHKCFFIDLLCCTFSKLRKSFYTLLVFVSSLH